MLNVRNTRPHCVEDAQMECVGETAFDLKFQKGYDGGHPQQFRLFYRRVGDDISIFDAWESTREFEEATLRLDGLDRFAKYQFFLETQNLLGATNCTLKDQYSRSLFLSLISLLFSLFRFECPTKFTRFWK
jgi:hypothetical protein